MAKFANIRPEQINKARRMLQDLPEKTERKTRQEAALLLESDLRKALKKAMAPKNCVPCSKTRESSFLPI